MQLSIFSGKNNVLVQPKGYDSLFLGYLSLHQITIVGEDSSSLVLKWTPNQLMNGNTTEEKSASWQNAISIDLKTILFLHCHQVRALVFCCIAAWIWLSSRFSCCLKMTSVENILGYTREQFYRFSRGCKPRENLWNCSRKYPKMFETYFIFRQQKIEFKPMSGVIMLLCNRMFCWIFG